MDEYILNVEIDLYWVEYFHQLGLRFCFARSIQSGESNTTRDVSNEFCVSPRLANYMLTAGVGYCLRKGRRRKYTSDVERDGLYGSFKDTILQW